MTEDKKDGKGSPSDDLEIERKLGVALDIYSAFFVWVTVLVVGGVLVAAGLLWLLAKSGI